MKFSKRVSRDYFFIILSKLKEQGYKETKRTVLNGNTTIILENSTSYHILTVKFSSNAWLTIY